MPFHRKKSLVGLDIGSSAVKAIQLERGHKTLRVRAIGLEPLPTDSIVDGAIVDSTAVSAAIRRLLNHSRFSTREVAASLSGNSVFVKKVNLPGMGVRDPAESIRSLAGQYLPFDVEDVVLDFEISEPASESNLVGTIGVTLVAAKKETVVHHTNVITQAGCVPAVIDVDAFALQNAYEANYGQAADSVVVLLNVGASATNVNVISRTESLFTRDIPIGGHAFTEAIQKELGVSFEIAEQVKTAQHASGALHDEAMPVLKSMTDYALLTIEQTFDFFRAVSPRDRIDRIVLSGGASRVAGFVDSLIERFGTDVEHFNPFRQIGFDARRLGVGPEEMAPISTVAVGLALRQVGDR